jgi:hypothetical protein
MNCDYWRHYELDYQDFATTHVSFFVMPKYTLSQESFFFVSLQSFFHEDKNFYEMDKTCEKSSTKGSINSVLIALNLLHNYIMMNLYFAAKK